MTRLIESWGRYPRCTPRAIATLPQACITSAETIGEYLAPYQPPYLSFGLQRSYGDVGLNDGGTMIDTSMLTGIIAADFDTGVITVAAGTSLDAIIRQVIPRGWMLPVVPGTRWITVGGAIANDIHGKNHHIAGSFGNHVLEIGLWWKGAFDTCSAVHNADVFRATIGGLGLTGLVVWATIQLEKVQSSLLDVWTSKVTLDAMVTSLHRADARYPYSVAWLDVQRQRGLLQLAMPSNVSNHTVPPNHKVNVPRCSSLFVNDLTVGIGNVAYFHALAIRSGKQTTSMTKFFFPLDVVNNWNVVYGRSGFLQYQFVVPSDQWERCIHQVLNVLRTHGVASYLAVVKTFGTVASKGIMSFPMPGVTLAMDVRNTPTARKALDECDVVVAEAGGRVYLAKDARLSPKVFADMYGEQLKEFSQHVDPAFSSSLWRRVNG
ncbi:MAG: FAD-binding oxidoreductase [Bradyrhizobiaceae bacterium]|nr:FAD-binding oxidoreductase [Bradyrhizobiaceae bacterium]